MTCSRIGKRRRGVRRREKDAVLFPEKSASFYLLREKGQLSIEGEKGRCLQERRSLRQRKVHHVYLDQTGKKEIPRRKEVRRFNKAHLLALSKSLWEKPRSV